MRSYIQNRNDRHVVLGNHQDHGFVAGTNGLRTMAIALPFSIGHALWLAACSWLAIKRRSQTAVAGTFGLFAMTAMQDRTRQGRRPRSRTSYSLAERS